MRLEAFHYELPAPLIAQEPLVDRTASRLMVVNRQTGRMQHQHFRDLSDILRKGDLLILNRSRVIPARLLLRRESGGRVELLTTQQIDDKRFLATGTPIKKLRPGEELNGEGFVCRIVERTSERTLLVEVVSSQTVETVLENHGHVPLPPYITRADTKEDRQRYQTVYSEESGSIAAPTAGLHFDNELLRQLNRRGVRVGSVVLHVGMGTFLPLQHDIVEENVLHSERYSVGPEAMAKIIDAKKRGGRVIAVGTTTARVIETVFQKYRGAVNIESYEGETDLFIYPPYEFSVIDGLITNFHLPDSSLLLLVSAFLGIDTTLACYNTAVEMKYRFYSYGDAMFIS